MSSVSAPSSPPSLAVEGLAIPFLSELDRDSLGEGSLDPLGLAGMAEGLAEFIAPHVTARMSRIRFLTAIAVAAVVNERLDDVVPGDGISSPDLVFEWHLVEGLARNRGLPADATRTVPGIGKARGMLSFDWSAHLDASSYLKSPRVFGFHGVYKRLARSLGIVHEGMLNERGVELVRVWEREQDLHGFVDARPGSSGGRFASRLTSAIRGSLLAARVQQKPGGYLLGELAASLRPDGGKALERARLRKGLLDTEEPRRREMLTHLVSIAPSLTERGALELIARKASPDLAEPIMAIDAYERVACLLDWGFQTLLYESTMQGTVPLPEAHAAKSPVFGTIATELPGAIDRAANKLEPIGLTAKLEPLVVSFGEQLTKRTLVDALLKRHRRVQDEKEKPMWVAVDERGFRIRRSEYRRTDPPVYPEEYLHPYRVRAMREFLSDLRGAR